MNDAVAVWVDGGCCQENPSPHGITWAAVYVDAAGIVVREASGHATCEQVGMGTVENNFAETLAIAQALIPLPDGWGGIVYGDNQNALRRARNALNPDYWSWTGVPRATVEVLRDEVRRMRPTFVLCSGHPTRAELAAGHCKKGRPVSRHNVRADELCGLEAVKLAWALGLI